VSWEAAQEAPDDAVISGRRLQRITPCERDPVHLQMATVVADHEDEASTSARIDPSAAHVLVDVVADSAGRGDG
jgi:hypothetical protein